MKIPETLERMMGYLRSAAPGAFGASEKPAEPPPPDGLHLTESGYNIHFDIMRDGQSQIGEMQDLARMFERSFARKNIAFSATYGVPPYLLSSALEPRHVDMLNGRDERWVSRQELFETVQLVAALWSAKNKLPVFMNGVEFPAYKPRGEDHDLRR